MLKLLKFKLLFNLLFLFNNNNCESNFLERPPSSNEVVVIKPLLDELAWLDKSDDDVKIVVELILFAFISLFIF